MIEKLILKVESLLLKNYRNLSIIIILVSTIMFFISLKYFNINTSMTILLPEDSPAVINYKKLIKLKGNTDSFIVLLECNNIDLAKKMAKDISFNLMKENLVNYVETERDVNFIKDHMALWLPISLLEKIKVLLKNKIFSNNNNFKSNEGKRIVYKKEAEIFKIFSLSDLINKFETIKHLSSSFLQRWNISNDGKVLIIKIFPKKPATDYTFSVNFKKKLDSVISKIKLNTPYYNTIKVKYSGPYVMMIDETNEIEKNVFSSVFLSFSLIFLVIFLYFGRLKILIVLFIPLFFGIIWTSGVFFIFATSINIISAFIFAILLGLGIDFSIHILSRYFREREIHGVEKSIIIALNNTGKRVTIGAITTMTAFVSLIFAQFRGFSQFGIIATLGIGINLISIYIVLPLSIMIVEHHMGGFRKSKNYFSLLFGLFNSHIRFSFIKHSFKIIVFFILMLSSITVFLLFNPPSFEIDFSKLNKTPVESQKKILKYTKDLEAESTPIVILAKSRKENKRILQALNRKIKYRIKKITVPGILGKEPIFNFYSPYNESASISYFLSIFSFYPNNQKIKSNILKDIENLIKSSNLSKLSPHEKAFCLDLLPYIQKAKPFKFNDIPAFIKNAFIDHQGSFFRIMLLFTKLNTANGRNAIKLYREIKGMKVNNENLNVTGQDLIFAEILMLMLKDSVQISLISFIFMFFVLLVANRSLKLTIIQIVPLIIGLFLFFFLLGIFNIKLNFFNMCVIPALIGIGIDSSVHISLSIEEIKNFDVFDGYMKVIGSVSLATITTIIGFAGLITASQKGLNSIGQVAIIGMLSVWFVTAILSPALIQYIKIRSKN